MGVVEEGDEGVVSHTGGLNMKGARFFTCDHDDWSLEPHGMPSLELERQKLEGSSLII
jgi:hypothetical protein